LAHERVLEASN
jgi:hypothetical protein